MDHPSGGTTAPVSHPVVEVERGESPDGSEFTAELEIEREKPVAGARLFALLTDEERDEHRRIQIWSLRSYLWTRPSWTNFRQSGKRIDSRASPLG